MHAAAYLHGVGTTVVGVCTDSDRFRLSLPHTPANRKHTTLDQWSISRHRRARSSCANPCRATTGVSPAAEAARGSVMVPADSAPVVSDCSSLLHITALKHGPACTELCRQGNAVATRRKCHWVRSKHIAAQISHKAVLTKIQKIQNTKYTCDTGHATHQRTRLGRTTNSKATNWVLATQVWWHPP
jgi:hypothetical protein